MGRICKMSISLLGSRNSSSDRKGVKRAQCRNHCLRFFQVGNILEKGITNQFIFIDLSLVQSQICKLNNWQLWKWIVCFIKTILIYHGNTGQCWAYPLSLILHGVSRGTWATNVQGKMKCDTYPLCWETSVAPCVVSLRQIILVPLL